MPNEWLLKKFKKKKEKKEKKEPENVVGKRKKNGKKKNDGQYEHFLFLF